VHPWLNRGNDTPESTQDNVMVEVSAGGAPVGATAGASMNRADLQALADERTTDAEVLLKAGRWTAAYYLLGHAVEAGIKACVARQFREGEVPARDIVQRFYSHGLEGLLQLSGLKREWEKKQASDPDFDMNWSMICGWNVDARYRVSMNEMTARDMFRAVTDASTGVLPWLKAHW